jgi:hypothetical protein
MAVKGIPRLAIRALTKPASPTRVVCGRQGPWARTAEDAASIRRWEDDGGARELSEERQSQDRLDRGPRGSVSSSDCRAGSSWRCR